MLMGDWRALGIPGGFKDALGARLAAQGVPRRLIELFSVAKLFVPDLRSKMRPWNVSQGL